MSSSDRQLVSTVTRVGITHEESRKGYETFSKLYNEHTKTVRYNGATLTAQYLCEKFPEDGRASVRIIDVGAGTGLVAKKLKEAGFRHIDALDSSAEMLEEARKTNYYENYYVEYLSKEPLDISANTYDGLTGSGCYAEGGHFPVNALYEMIRLVKPGGYIVLAARATLFTPSAPDTNKDLEPLMDQLEQQGKWRRICRNVGKAKFVCDIDAIAWVYQVL